MSAAELHSRLTGLGFDVRRDGARLLISPSSRLTDDLADAIRANRDGLLALVAAPAAPKTTTALSITEPTHGTPGRCLAPLACGILGICGRLVCVGDDERERFAAAIEVARDPCNPHRVPDFGPREGKHRV